MCQMRRSRYVITCRPCCLSFESQVFANIKGTGIGAGCASWQEMAENERKNVDATFFGLLYFFKRKEGGMWESIFLFPVPLIFTALASAAKMTDAPLCDT